MQSAQAIKLFPGLHHLGLHVSTLPHWEEKALYVENELIRVKIRSSLLPDMQFSKAPLLSHDDTVSKPAISLPAAEEETGQGKLVYHNVVEWANWPWFILQKDAQLGIGCNAADIVCHPFFKEPKVAYADLFPLGASQLFGYFT